jgi:hypothetical protein
MPADASSTQSRLSAGPISRLWANGWGARLILIGSAVSFYTLFSPWAVGTWTSGYVDHDTDGTRTTVFRVFHPGDDVSGGNAFDRDFITAVVFAGLMALSVYIASRPLRPGQAGGARWVPLVCTALLLFNAVSTVFQLGAEADAFGNGVTIRGIPGAGPAYLGFAQIIVGVGALLFLRRPRSPV